jgi:hypothetical protein
VAVLAVAVLLVLVAGGIGGAVLIYRWTAKKDADVSAEKKEKSDEPQDRTTYEIKVRKRGQGDRSRLVEEETQTVDVVGKDANGKVVEEFSQKTVTNFRYAEELLVKAAGRKSEKARREYERARVSEGGKTETLPYEGKTVLIEKTDGGYVFTVEGSGPLTGQAARFLQREFMENVHDEDPLEKHLPGRPVTVGEAWKVDAAAAFFRSVDAGGGLDIDLEGARGEGRLVRAYKKNGRQFGVIEIALEAPVKALRLKESKINFKSGAKMTFFFTADLCVDGTATIGSATVKVTLHGSGPFSDRGRQLTMTVDRQEIGKFTIEPPPK